MKATIDLLEAACKRYPSDAELCRLLGVSRTTVSVARTRGKVSPILAGRLAELLDLNVEHWMALASLEAAPRSRVTDHLRRVLHAIAYKLTRLTQASSRRARA